MNFVKHINSKIKLISLSGTENLTSYSEIRHVKITNYGCIIAILSALIYNVAYIIVDFRELWPLIINYDLIIPFVLIGFYLNKNYHHNASKIILNLVFTIPTLTGTILFSGSETGIHFYFLLFAVVPILFWPLKKVEYIILFFSINIFAFIYVEFYSNPENVLLKFPENSLLFFNIFSMVLTFVTIVFVMLIFQNQVENNEILLEEQSNVLSEINDDLITKNEEILTQNDEILEQRNELDKINKTKEKFFSIIAHDLKSPFNAILGFSELLLAEKNIEGKEKDKIIEIINSTAEQTLQLLENLLLWSKLEKDEVHFRPQKLIVKDLILADFSLFRNIAEKKELNVSLELENNIKANIDKNMFSIIIRNLISNAIKFTDRNGNIIIKCEGLDDKINVSITDDGVGIEEKRLSDIFSNDLNNTTPGTEKEKGTGLGLKLCYEFAKRNNAELNVESNLGEGSKFSLIIDSE